MSMTEDSASLNEWAKAYEKKHRHPPLILGREYVYLDDWFRLIDCEWREDSREEFPSAGICCTVENRYGSRAECSANELSWKKEMISK
jgi:hypothetical protein